jgi:hypothetical protein
MQPQSPPRYPKMVVHPLGVAHLHKRNPWMALACSVALPGLGHFYCGAYYRGFLLMSWEITVNQLGRVNHAVFLTAMGHADMAQAVINYRWAMIYPVFYVLAMWDAYCLTVDLNKMCEIEERQPRRHFPPPIALTFSGVNYLSKRNPWMAMFLSIFLGGAGHFYTFKSVKAVMLMGWHLAIWLNSGLNRAILATVQGNWHEVHTLVDYQWLLFWPSIHLFNIWNAWSDTVELNKLYEEQIEVWLRDVTGQEKPNTLPTGVPS